METDAKRCFGKRRLLLFIIVICLSMGLLCSCQSKAAKAADSMILAIGDVDLSSEKKIIDAENTVKSLNDKERDSLKHLDMLEQARISFDAVVRTEKISKVENAIKEIGNVGMQSGEAISVARSKYDDLEDDLKQEVGNLIELTNAEEQYAILVAEQEDREAKAEEIIKMIDRIKTVELNDSTRIEKAQNAYNEAAADVQALVINYPLLEEATTTLQQLQIERAAEIDSLITEIGEVTEDSKEAITEARNAYNSADNVIKDMVTHFLDLVSAEAKYRELKIQKVENALSTLRNRYDEVSRYTTYESYTMPYYINTRSYVLPYLAKDNKNVYGLVLDFVYYGDEWIFFDKVTFAIDDKRITKYFDYFDISHNNSRGSVWEYYTADGKLYLDILEDVAESETTIIRFSGDVDSYDLTVSQNDKKAIREILDIYYDMVDAGYTIIG